MKEKWIKATQMIFAYGMSVLLVMCLITALIYIAALIIGQPASAAIHEVMSGKVLPWVYYAGILLSFDGLLNLYLKGELLFRLDIPKQSERKQNPCE